MSALDSILDVSTNSNTMLLTDDAYAITGKQHTSLEELKEIVLQDYRIACESRNMSLLARREVLTGKAKFGISGDGKELPQIALAKVFQNGDWRSGYYRDQTWMLASGNVTLEQLFAQLYADPSIERDPHSSGRQMNGHFSSRNVNPDGSWCNLMNRKNTASDISCTAGQMARAVGLALASKKYREVTDLATLSSFSNAGHEAVFVSIGDASTSEGVFWEAINAAGVMQIPMAISIWDDGYGISVPTKYQTTKGSISKVLAGFEIEELTNGIRIYTVIGWDYPTLCQAYREAIAKMREDHVPVLIHVKELTQPQGHSTSGSHERYKSKERLEWERAHDCNLKMKEWILEMDIATEEELNRIEKATQKRVREAKKIAWKQFNEPIKHAISEVQYICTQLLDQVHFSKRAIKQAQQTLETALNPTRKEVAAVVRQLLIDLKEEPNHLRQLLIDWKNRFQNRHHQLYQAHLYSSSPNAAIHIPETKPIYSDHSPVQNGYQILNACFDAALARDPRIFAFGEDVGQIGDVNQAFAGLQEKYGIKRVFDTGIRENTIMGQGIGMAMRGLRPIAEIQYLDYFMYGMQPIVDDLATLRYRSGGNQQAPMIIRTRGHRLEGIWHTGSPLGMILNGIRGVYVLVPRNMTQAAGFYNTMLQANDPALIIECLNGYRLKERLPDNIGEFTVPIGVPEIIRSGVDLTLVTYGSCCRIAMKAAELLSEVDIEVEVMDARSLLPFDRPQMIVQSLEKTNRVLFMDEDVPGGATAFMLQQVLEKQNGYRYLDSAPATITATENRGAYGSDGDYYCKPNVHDVFEKVYAMMHEADPELYPMFF